MTSQSDEPTQPIPSANSENFYIAEADQIVVNELLTFVSDKINTLPYDMIVKLLVDFYSDDDIASAKNILFQTAFNDRDAPRLIKRKGKDKCLNNVQDILNIFLEMPPQSVPCYVAKELSRLPPLSMNCFDVSSLVKDMESVKLHLLILQESHETLMKAQLDKCQVRSSPESVSAEHHYPRSACAVSVDMDDQHVIDVVDKSECTDDDLVLLASIQQTTPPPTHRQRKSVNNNRQTSASTQARRNTYAESVTRGRRQPNKHGRPASLTTTQTDSAMIRGNGTSSNIRSANTKRRASTSKARKQVGVFITRLARSTNPKDLATHVKRETGLSVSCEPLRTKFDTYSSFCVRLPPRDQHLLLDSRVWPSGVMVRAFLE